MQEEIQELTTEAPEVSVVMSVYNAAQHLRETVDSILSQEGVEFEVVVVDDGSTDDTANILCQYASRDARVRVITQENQGLTRALIKGCAAATGKYIARQDVGDTSAPRRLNLQKQALDADDELAFVSSWTEFCGPEWEHLYLTKGTGFAKSPTYIFLDNNSRMIDGPTSHPSVMYRRAAYLNAGGYRPEFYCAQDFDLWYRLMGLGKFQLIEDTLYRARVTLGSISAGDKKEQEALGALARACFLRRQRGLSDLGILAKANRIRPGRPDPLASRDRARAYYFIGECLRNNSDRRSLIYFKESISADPFFLKSWARLLCLAFSLRKTLISS